MVEIDGRQAGIMAIPAERCSTTAHGHRYVRACRLDPLPSLDGRKIFISGSGKFQGLVWENSDVVFAGVCSQKEKKGHRSASSARDVKR